MIKKSYYAQQLQYSRTGTKSSKKLNLQDIISYDSNQLNPFAYSSNSKSPSKKSQYSKHIYKTPRGMMARNISERIEEYKKRNTAKNVKQNIERLTIEMEDVKNGVATYSPSISPNSKSIFAKTLKKRNLSPKVLERFEQYESSKNLSKIREKINRFIEQTHQVPKPRDIMPNLRESESKNLKKMIIQISKEKQFR